ncbi:MAG: hypothetical protein Fur0016_01270 [Anaerolineales bacterium]
MNRIHPISLLFLAWVLAACNLPRAAPQAAPTVDAGLVSTIAAQTLEALYTPAPTRTNTPAPSSTPNVTATPTPTITPTYETPTARFEGDTNCRSGPGTSYEVITVARSGQKAEITGKSEQGNFWFIKNPNGEGTCWVAGDFIRTSGSVHVLPTVTAPPTPTAAPPKAPAWKNWTYSCVYASGGSNATVQLAWSDNSPNEDGFNIYRNDQVIASFGPNTTTYTDVAFVAAGGSLTYVVEVYRQGERARSSPVTVTCQ